MKKYNKNKEFWKFTCYLLISCFVYNICVNIYSSAEDVKHMFGFFYLTYKKRKSTELAFNEFRKFYPDAPIHIFTDLGGYNYSDLCKNHNNCRWNMSPIKIGHNFQSEEPTVLNSTLVKMKIYFNEMVTAAKWMNTNYTVYFEPDVWFQNNITELDYPKGDIGGIYNPWYTKFKNAINSYIANQTNGKPMFHARVIYACNYVRNAALIDSVTRVLPTIDWEAIHKLDDRIPETSDTSIPILFAMAGYHIHPWNAACEYEEYYHKRSKGRNCGEAPMKHKDNPAADAVEEED